LSTLFEGAFLLTKAQQFARLIAAAGWSQAEVARRLQITAGAVSQICSGKTQPRASTLNLLKLLLAREKPEALALQERAGMDGLEAWESDLLEELRKLPEAQRRFLVQMVKQMIKALPSVAHRKSRR